MILQLFTIARNTFVESLRQPVVFLLVVLSGLFQVFNTWNTGFSMGQESATEVKGDDKLLLDVGLATVFVMGTLLAGFIATAVLSREIENKTVLTVISKPVGRPILILGKYLGVLGAIMLAVVAMFGFLLLALRHGVMSTAADGLDGPTLVFGLSAVALALIIGAWCNYFYGWNFPQTSLTLLVPLVVVAYLVVLFISKKWTLQHPGSDLKPQILVACLCLTFAITVLTAVAIAASTRLGQVMTIVVCLGIFLFALLSNHLFGRHVFDNESVATVTGATPADPSKTGFTNLGEQMVLQLEHPTSKPIRPGDAVFFSPSPSGFPMLTTHPYERFAGDLSDDAQVFSDETPASLVATGSRGNTLNVRVVGALPAPVSRPPEDGDYVFLRETKVNPVALAVWGVVPNLQSFWLLDSVSQNRDVPGRYLVLAAAYGLAQIAMFLSLAVMLFQRRDVG